MAPHGLILTITIALGAAFLGGFVAARAGLHAALLLIAAGFALSTLVIVLSPLARLRVLPEPACA